MGFLQKILMAILRPILLLLWGIARMAIFVLILAIAAMIFWRGMFEAAVVNTAEAVLGVPVEVRGGVNVTLDGGLGLAVSDMVVENPGWAVRDNLLKIDTMVVHVNPWALATGRMLINDMTLSGMSLSLERGADGAGGVTNYAPILVHFSKKSAPPGTRAVTVKTFTVSNATVFVRDGDSALELDMPLMKGRYNAPSEPGALELDTLSLYGGGSDITGALLIEPGFQRPRINGALSASVLDLPRLIMRPSSALPLPEKPYADLAGLGGALETYLVMSLPVLKEVDINIRMDVGHLRLPWLSANGVHVVLLAEGNWLTVREVEE